MGKKWLIIVSVIVIVCIVVFGGSMLMAKYETNRYDVNEDYKNISIAANAADIVLAPSESEDTYVICQEPKNTLCNVSITDGTLSVWLADTRNWYERIANIFRTPQITVYLPQGEYSSLSVKGSTGDVEIPNDFRFESMDISESTGNVRVCASVSETAKIKATTGNIHIEGISAGVLDLSVSTGRITVSDITCKGTIKANVTTGETGLTNITCKSLISSGSTGDITLHNVIAEEKFSINRSTGDITFIGSDAGEIFAQTDTGDVTGSLLSEKIFLTETDTGDIDVPKTVTGGRCEITTDTGDIELDIKG